MIQIRKTTRIIYVCLVTIMTLVILTGCGKSSYRITPKKDYNDFDSDFDFLDSKTKQAISNLMKSAVDWYNDVDIPDDYSAVNLEILTSVPFSDYGEQLMQLNEEHDYRGSDEGMRHLKATMPAISITGAIWGISSNNNIEASVGAGNNTMIEMSEDDWNSIKDKILSALEFYYEDGDRSEMNSYGEDGFSDETVSIENVSSDSELISEEGADKNCNPIVLYRDDKYREIDYSNDFVNIQDYLDYVGAAANNECIYLPKELSKRINEVEFIGYSGTFKYIINGPSFKKDIICSDWPIEYVRYGEWNSNGELEEDQVLDLMNALDSIYGKHSISYSDGQIVKEVKSPSKAFDYSNHHFSLRWDDVGHYSFIWLNYHCDKTANVEWSVDYKDMLGYEPIIAVNNAVSKLGLKEDELKSITYVDISDLVTINPTRELFSKKGYIVKIDYLEGKGNNEIGTQYYLVYVLLDEYFRTDCHNDENISAADIESIYINRSPIEYDVNKIQFEPVEGSFVKYNNDDYKANTEQSSQTESQE